MIRRRPATRRPENGRPTSVPHVNPTTFVLKSLRALAVGHDPVEALALTARHAAERCRAHVSAIVTFNGQRTSVASAYVLHGATHVGVVSGFAAVAELRDVVAAGSGAMRSVDMLRDRRAVVQGLGRHLALRAFLAVRIAGPQGLLGLLIVGRRRPQAFTVQDERLLRTLACTASLAIQLALHREAAARPPHQMRRTAPAAAATPSPKGAITEGAHLTSRQREVFDLLTLGRTAKEIGALLDLSTRTVEHHVERLRRRLGVARARDLIGSHVGSDRWPTP